MTSPVRAPSPPESQPQRTRFAWRRTGLAILATTLLAVALVARRGHTAAAGFTLVPVLALAAAGLILADRRARALDRPGYARLNRSVPALGLLILAEALLAVALVLLTAT